MAQTQQFRQQLNKQANNIKETLKEIQENQEQMVVVIKNKQLAQKNVKTQLGQLSQALFIIPQGGLPSDTEYPMQVIIITLSSGRDLFDRTLSKNKKVKAKLASQSKEKKQVAAKDAKKLRKSE